MYPKYLSPYSLCMAQEYIFQAAAIFKASIIGVICSVTWSVVTKKKLHNKSEFLSIAMMWMILPTVSLPLSIAFGTGDLWCTLTIHDNAVIGYSISFMLPLFACVLLDFVLYFRMRITLSELEKERSTTTLNPNKAKLHLVIQKLMYLPLVFGLSWTMELILVMMYLCGAEGLFFEVFDVAASVGICSTGLTIAVIYFCYQKEHPPLIKSLYHTLLVCLPGQRSHANASTNAEQSCMSSTVGSSVATVVVHPRSPPAVAAVAAAARKGNDTLMASTVSGGIAAGNRPSMSSLSFSRDSGKDLLLKSDLASSMPSVSTLDIEGSGSIIQDDLEWLDVDIVEY